MIPFVVSEKPSPEAGRMPAPAEREGRGEREGNPVPPPPHVFDELYQKAGFNPERSQP